jgi:hypothetical protein
VRLDRYLTCTHLGSTFTTTPNNRLIELAHLRLSLVPSLITRQGQVGEHEVDRSEPSIERFVTFGKSLVQLSPNFLSLQGGGSRKDSQFGHGMEGVEAFPFVGRFQVLSKEVERLLFDQGHVDTEVLSGKTELDHPLLLHEHFVGTIVNDTFTENGGSQVLSSTEVSSIHSIHVYIPK